MFFFSVIFSAFASPFQGWLHKCNFCCVLATWQFSKNCITVARMWLKKEIQRKLKESNILLIVSFYFIIAMKTMVWSCQKLWVGKAASTQQSFWLISHRPPNKLWTSSQTLTWYCLVTHMEDSFSLCTYRYTCSIHSLLVCTNTKKPMFMFLLEHIFMVYLCGLDPRQR